MPEKEPTRDDEPQVVKPAADGPHEIEDAAAQEAEYPEDETGEG
jgi:hypothetical protein